MSISRRGQGPFCLGGALRQESGDSGGADRAGQLDGPGLRGGLDAAVSGMEAGVVLGGT